MRQVSAWAETNHCTKNTVKERAPLESVYYCTYFSWVKHIYNKSMEWINKASRYVKRLLSFMKTIWQYCLTKTTSHTATIESVHQQIDRQMSGKLFYILELRHPLVFTWWSGSLLTLRFRQKLSQFHDLFWSKKGQRSRVVSISWKISLFRSRGSASALKFA